ncbi:thymidylate synthase (FAD) [Candidatus Jorgensenbacteria bacterium CG03_land_8_20_14_0_80_38_39]|nr:MAG: thymidylate synthase (FAD) [Candidatus Jorgensenbacteria bacterium CG03_land_8_20_14_0_80_38_39]
MKTKKGEFIMGNLDVLKKRFNPRRFYRDETTGTEIEVDGAFVRIDPSLESQRGKEVIEIPLEDLLQDPAVIRSARVSTGRDTKDINEKAGRLIEKLYSGHHETPFEGGVTLRLKVITPICYAEPFFQLPLSHNERSLRYSAYNFETEHFFIPPVYRAKQWIVPVYEEGERESQKLYQFFLSQGVSREQARFALLFRFFTEFYWTVSLRHLLEILSWEPNVLTPAAFWSIRDNLIAQIIKDWTPWTADVVFEKPRLTPTNFGLSHSSEIIEAMLETLKKQAQKEDVVSIGSIWFLPVCGNDEILKLGVLTNPNPRRGFGHASMTFLLNIPIFVYRQWVRHRYGAWSALPTNFDEVVHHRDFYLPLSWRRQLGGAMDYNYEEVEPELSSKLRLMFFNFVEGCCRRYRRLRQFGVPPQDAALNLPYVFRVKRLWTANVESLMNFFSLRCDKQAQWEIRQFAHAIYPRFRKSFPWVNEIFLRYLNFGKSSIFR